MAGRIFVNHRRDDSPANGSDCAVCPEMVLVPADSFTVGTPESEAERDPDAGPLRQIAISKSFAVGKFELTFAE